MPITTAKNLNGFNFVFINTYGGKTVIGLDFGDEKMKEAMLKRDPNFLSALEKLARDYDEIRSVLLVEESYSMWLQCGYAENWKSEMEKISNSEYASEDLKHWSRAELKRGMPAIPKQED